MPSDQMDQGSPFSVTAGEYMEVPSQPGDLDISEADDGGLIVDMQGEESGPEPDGGSGFYRNLVMSLSMPTQDAIVQYLLPLIEEDKKAREERDEQYAEGIKRTGLGGEAPGGAEFEGASRAVHPMLTEACVDYEARIIKELLPLSGAVKPRIIGKPTTEKDEKAKRKTDHMNWQLRTQIKETRSVLEQTLTQVPLGGSQYVRLWYDARLKRPKMEFAPIDRVIIPATAANFSSAERKTFIDRITSIEYRRRVDDGMYADIDLPSPSQLPDETQAETASNRVEGVSDTGMNLDGERELYEVLVHFEVTDDMAADLAEDGVEAAGKIFPYLITIDHMNRRMLAAYRAWEKDDPAHEEIAHLFDFGFIPWRGPLGIGLPQLIGNLSAAATGALRALLDSAHVNNVPGGLIMKGAGARGQTVQAKIGEFADVDVGMEADDIRKRIMPYSFNPTSPVLFQLLGFLVDAAKGVVRTSMEESATDAATPVPVGTQLSRVEEGLTVYAAIHLRAYESMDRLLAGLHRLNRLYMPATLTIDDDGKEIFVQRSDYEGPVDVQPVSEPTIYSDQQRWAQLQYIQQRAAAVPGMYKMRAVELAGLKLVKWPDPESLLTDAPQPHELNAVNENLALSLGQPVVVYPEQDHLAHLQVLLDFMKSPVLGANPAIAPKFLPGAVSHASEHLVYLYVERTVQMVTQAAGGMHPAEMMSMDPTVKRKMDELLAHASSSVVPSMEQTLSGAMPVLQAAMQQLQQMAPKPPMDPAQAALQAAQAETQRKSQVDQMDAQLRQAALALDQREKEETAEQKAADLAASLQREAMGDATQFAIAALRVLAGVDKPPPGKQFVAGGGKPE